MAGDDYLRHLREIRIKKKRPPQSIAEVLGNASFRNTLRKKSRLDRIKDAWRRIGDSLMSEHTEVASFRSGEVRITCTSHAMASEYATHRHSELLDALNTELDGKDRVSRLNFRAGRLR
ncbi:MAG: DUF721 domain-containing protein [Planctomycetes bacterium]|nr:DUF721 domain-containing protein [Planctomycetota bacterium]